MAAVLSPDQEIVHAPLAEITKWEDGPDGSLYVYGRATTPEVDTDEQILKESWSGPALQEWMEKAPTIRVQHNGLRDPAGSGVRVEINRDGDGAHWVKGVVDEPIAQRLVRKGHLRAFSVGVAAPVIERDMTGKAKGGIITGGRIVEVSLVDSPANRSCFLEMAKADKNGNPEWTGALTAPDEVLAKVAEPAVTKAAANGKTVTVELPKNVSVSFSPKDLAKLVEHRKVAEQREVVKVAEPDVAKAGIVGEHGPELVPLTGADEIVTPALKAMMGAEAAIYKRDIDTATRRRLASEGRALSNLSYPVETHEDADNAVTLLLSGHGNVAAARRMVSRIARKEGWKDILERLKGAKKGKKADKAADPDVTKCMKCDGSGMVDGSPCPSCKPKKAKKAVRKALAPEVAKKRKTMCSGCGAKQSVKHANCAECGKPMPRPMPAVTKNHDFACLGCGHDPLDKGEKHCPSCGRENPGYNMMADHKIPANKAAKERVTKRKKAKAGKGKKPMTDGGGDSFGGHRAPPFGAKDGDEDGGGKGKMPPKAKKAAKPKATKRKGKGKGRSPAAGVAGHDGDTMGLPAHREPDGAPIEEFEKDTNLTDGDERQEMAAAMRHKALAARGMSRDEALLHDLTCPAFSPEDVRKAFPYASFASTDTSAWQRQALMKAASGDPRAMAARDLFAHAETLKNAPADILHEMRVQAHQAFLDANKMITDATPGPGTFPTPGHAPVAQFRRPYIDTGHAAPSPQHAAPHSFPVMDSQPSAEDFTRPFITEGRAADSPANDTPRHEPMPAPMDPGKPSRMYYTNAMRDNVEQAMRTMHDHIAGVYPDACPMSPQLDDIQKPAPQVPDGVGNLAPRTGRKAAKAAAGKQRKALARKRRRLERKVLKGTMSVKQARRKLGLKAKARKPASVAKTATAWVPNTEPGHLQPDLEALTRAVAEANAPLLERIAAQDKTLRKQRKAIDAIASQPDTSQAPLRGVALAKASAAPAVPQSATATAERVQMAELQRLHYVSRSSPDPGMREAARRDLETKLGLDSMNTQA